MTTVFAIDFPPVSHVVEWPIGPLGINKVVVLMWLSVAIVAGFMIVASRKQALIPKGIQNVAESAVDFVREGIILQTMGESGLGYTPFLLTMFSFIFVCNIWEIIPVAQMPVNARIALPVFMALLVWVIFVGVGVVKQGPIHYFKNICFPPGVPKPIYLLIAPIEFISTIFVRPLSQSVRLFANMLAGHLLLTTFAIITASLWSKTPLIAIWPFSLFLLIALTGFEVLVAFLQAFIFTILTAVYIGSSAHPEH